MSPDGKKTELLIPGREQALAVQAVMLDLDGTLVNTLGDFDLALNNMLAEQQWPSVERERIGRWVGKGSPYLIREALLHLGKGNNGVVDDELYERIHTRYQEHYDQINGRDSHLYPGVKEGVQKLHATGMKLACITNKPTWHATALLQQLGIAEYFSCIHGGEFFPRRKPDPMPLVETARILGSAPADTLMIGDSANDSQAAHGAGCPVVLVRYGYNHGDPIEGVPALGYLDSLADIQLQP
ncbi:MAG: phosphoglycolate phosphatase [Brachymonas sp.]|nr:phosphoglycolate phosphatase [Brachymonas sp.]